MKMLNNSQKNRLLLLSCILLILLWSYTAFSKMVELKEFKLALANQNLKKPWIPFLAWFIPLSEILAAFLLLCSRTRFWGFLLSAILMLIFTIYIGLVIGGFFNRIPCSCGGVLKELGWHAHFWFNVFFLALSTIGVALAYKRR